MQQTLVVDHVSKIYHQGSVTHLALDEVNIEIKGGEFFTLLGPSGCGKTTLLRMIAGFDTPTSGFIRLGAERISHLPPNRRPINTVFQNYALFPHLNVRENVGFGLRMLGQSKEQTDARTKEMLRIVRLENFAERRIEHLSGGQQQRVALARALAPDPKLLLLDEPLSALDYKLRKEMQSELQRIQREAGISFVFVIHDQSEALAMSDRIAVMAGGRVLQVGTPTEIYARPAHRFVADFVGEANFVPVKINNVADGWATAMLSENCAVRAPTRADLPANTTVDLVIRPESIRLLPSETGASLRGVVQATTYLGTDTMVTVATNTGTTLTVRFAHIQAPDVNISLGAPVYLHIPDGVAQIVEA